MNLISKEKNILIKILYLLPIIFIALILFLSILEPYLEYKRCVLAESIFKTLHKICHQAPSRSIWIGNYTIALCSRCFALYLALLITGIVIYVKEYKKIRWIIGLLFILPLLVDGLTQSLELRISNNPARLITGAFGGVGIGLFFYPIYIKFIAFFKKIKLWREVKN